MPPFSCCSCFTGCRGVLFAFAFACAEGRHGGITEIGASGQDDMRAVSGYKTLEVTRIYNKANAEKARQIAMIRRLHISRLGVETVTESNEN